MSVRRSAKHCAVPGVAAGQTACAVAFCVVGELATEGAGPTNGAAKAPRATAASKNAAFLGTICEPFRLLQASGGTGPVSPPSGDALSHCLVFSEPPERVASNRTYVWSGIFASRTDVDRRRTGDTKT